MRIIRKIIDKITGLQNINWSRVVMQGKCDDLIRKLNPEKLTALEISGNRYKDINFASYKSAWYPEFDICASVTSDKFDLVIAEQVFEHLIWPYRAGKNVYSMLNTGGWFLISVPFLVKIHNYPIDCTRWTELGLKYFLVECGFDITLINTDSWGNRRCVSANFEKWIRYRKNLHSLVNEKEFPYHVWAIAQKQ